MSIGRGQSKPANGVRDAEADYIEALKYEYAAYAGAEGLGGKAEQIADELRAFGHDVKKPKQGAKETAVSEPPLEKAVETENPKGEKPTEEAAEEPAEQKKPRAPRQSAKKAEGE